MVESEKCYFVGPGWCIKGLFAYNGPLRSWGKKRWTVLWMYFSWVVKRCQLSLVMWSITVWDSDSVPTSCVSAELQRTFHPSRSRNGVQSRKQILYDTMPLWWAFRCRITNQTSWMDNNIPELPQERGLAFVYWTIWQFFWIIWWHPDIIYLSMTTAGMLGCLGYGCRDMVVMSWKLTWKKNSTKCLQKKKKKMAWSFGKMSHIYII